MTIKSPESVGSSALNDEAKSSSVQIGFRLERNLIRAVDDFRGDMQREHGLKITRTAAIKMLLARGLGLTKAA